MLAVIGDGSRWQIVHQHDTAAKGMIGLALKEYTPLIPPPHRRRRDISRFFIECRELPIIASEPIVLLRPLFFSSQHDTVVEGVFLLSREAPGVDPPSPVSNFAF